MTEFVMVDKKEIQEVIAKIYNIRKLTKNRQITKTVDTMAMLNDIEQYIKDVKVLFHI